jgi:DNA polymerase-1
MWRAGSHRKKVLDWRAWPSCAALADALPGYINAKTGRVHTSYAVASTRPGGWLHRSQSEIFRCAPKRSRRIRRAFIRQSNKLISADYSQIELAYWPISPTFPS